MSDRAEATSQTPPSAELSPKTEQIYPELMSVVALLRRIHTQYPDVIARLREEEGIYNRGCGPSSYALAVMMEWECGLPIDASFSSVTDSSDGIHIVFGMEREGLKWIDHAWIEVTFKGQTILVSHESNPHSSAASFRAAAIYTHALNKFYEEMGLRRISEAQLHELNLTAAQQELAKKVIDQINEGRAPENYLSWFQCMMTRLDWRQK